MEQTQIQKRRSQHLYSPITQNIEHKRIRLENDKRNEQSFTVSIITPAYNSEKYISETILSIQNQTFQDWELLITDDCSTDHTWMIICEFAKKDHRIKTFQLQKNSGPGIARNNSIKHASGRFIAFCDSDDCWLPEKLEKQLKFQQENNLALSFSSYKIIDENGRPTGQVKAPGKVTYKKMLRNNYVGCLTAIYDKDKIGKVFMPEIRKRQDWALWLKILKLTPYALSVQENLAVYRERNVSVSSGKISLIKYNWKILREVENFSTPKSTLFLSRFLFYYLVKKLDNE